jgi:subtilisin-like proprotein convertase family protein/uncharacterized protein YvpB
MNGNHRNNSIMLLIILIFLFFTLSIFLSDPIQSSAQEPSQTLEASLLAQESIVPTLSPSPTTTNSLQLSTPPSIYVPFISNPEPPTPTPTPTSTQPPPELDLTTVLYCNSRAIDIPDNNPNGVHRDIQIADSGYVYDIEVRLDVSHPWVGDLTASLTHQDTGTRTQLIDRPGLPGVEDGCSQDNIEAILYDQISLPVEDRCSSSPASIAGIYKPEETLAAFNQESANGTWTLNISDNYKADAGSLNEWCLAITESNIPASPTPTPIVGSLPSHASISRISGQPQAMPLDCESRSAVDWANFFGVKIDEYGFFNSLPTSDHPDLGFVGNVWGSWGQIPPYPYGVHAEPVAASLRDYGLNAYAHRPLSWDQLRAEIAAGRPVIVWIVGNVTGGIPEYYETSDDPLSVVARYEHTVIVTAYTSDSVSYLNGSTIYTRTLNQFLESWSVMRNMAITARP